MSWTWELALIWIEFFKVVDAKCRLHTFLETYEWKKDKQNFKDFLMVVFLWKDRENVLYTKVQENV